MRQDGPALMSGVRQSPSILKQSVIEGGFRGVSLWLLCDSWDSGVCSPKATNAVRMHTTSALILTSYLNNFLHMSPSY